MSSRRIFLDPQQPPLPEVIDYVARRYRSGNCLRGDRVIMVVPGARAKRHLLDLFLAFATSAKLSYFPPAIVSVGELPEKLYQPQRTLASKWVQQLTWCRAVQAAPLEVIAQIVPTLLASGGEQLEATWNHERWLHLGELLCAHYRTLAADGYSFHDVAAVIDNDSTLADGERWHAMAVIQDTYLRMLDDMELWDTQTARLVAVRERECTTDRDILLVGTVDLNETLCDMLRQVNDRVTALIHAPVTWSDRFDDFGALLPGAWANSPIGLREEHIHVVDGPTEQSKMVCQILGDYDQSFRADQVVIGVPDERLVPYLQRALRSFGVVARWGPGQTIAEATPSRLLASIADWLQSPNIETWGALLRHTDLAEWLMQQGVSLTVLGDFDEYCAARVPSTLDGEWPTDGASESLVKAYQLIVDLMAPLTGPVRPIRQWCPAIQTLILDLYGSQEFEPGRQGQQEAWNALQAIQQQLAEFQRTPVELDEPVSSTDALQLVLRHTATVLSGAPRESHAIELLGWLDLLQSDATAIIVTSMNEGFVPTSVRTDQFMPNALRSVLEIDDNARRYARDAYTLQVLLLSRRQLDVITARTNVDSDPLLPSRLLFATPDHQLADRTKMLLAIGSGHEQLPTPADLVSWRKTTGFAIPEPVLRPASADSSEPTTQTRVRYVTATGIRLYLQCPYRYYLSFERRLHPAAEAAYEIDAGQFGNLLHNIMCSFGNSNRRHSKNPATIFKKLDELLDEHSHAMFGSSPQPAARVQIAQLRRRLQRFAEVQACRVQDGWRIHQVEVDVLQETGLLAHEQIDLRLRGRIDRIDVHEQDGRVAVLDYKTSEQGKSPEKTHRKSNGEWIDLQLPVYRHLARELNLSDNIELGYIVMSPEEEGVEFAMACWGETELNGADQQILRVMRAINAQQFWPPSKDFDPAWDDYAAICMTSVQEQPESPGPEN